MKELSSTLSASILLLLMICITTFDKRDDAKWFSFGWTRRVGIPNALDSISHAYQNNRDTSPASINNLNMLIMDSAYCKPVNLGGQLSWRQEDVSGLCKCLRHAHTEYEHAVCSPATRQCVPKDSMNSPQNVFKIQWIVQNTFKRCFEISRPTQVEDLQDPYTHSYVMESTNTVAAAIYWNAISTLSIMFVYFYDDLAANISTPMQDLKKWAVTFLLVGTVVTCVLSGVSLGLVHNGDMILPLVSMVMYMLFLFAQIFLGRSDPNNFEEKRVFGKKVIFWSGYILVMPCILTCYNMLTQRRDANFNWAAAISMLVFGLTALAAECFYALGGMTRDADAKRPGITTGGQAAVNITPEKSTFFSFILYSAVVQVASIMVTNQSSMSDYSFDSTYIGLCIALPVMIGTCLFQISRLAVCNPLDHESSLYWLHGIMKSEVFARTIFTLCVVYDLRSLSRVDNILL